MTLPEHGTITCRACFNELDINSCSPAPKWKIVNDPCAWGSAKPTYLVLGFSKGFTQADAFKNKPFEQIAFAGMHPRLTAALRSVGILNEGEDVNSMIADPDSRIAFGSLVRCSVSRIDEKASRAKGHSIYSCTGSTIAKSFREIPNILENCSRIFLLNLPTSVRAVLFLGNQDSYVSDCQSLLEKLFPDSFSKVNQVAADADSRRWVHLAHPSGLNGHFNTWLTSNQGSGEKRLLAQEALADIAKSSTA